MKGKLYVCATPIGNLEDVSYRLVRILGEVDLVAAEDTRRTRKLLTHYGVQARLSAYHDANERKQTSYLIDKMAKGTRVALVTDGGMPGVSRISPHPRLHRLRHRHGGDTGTVGRADRTGAVGFADGAVLL